MIPLEIKMDVEQSPIARWDELRLTPDQLLALKAVGVLTKGTEEGRPVVIVRVDTPDGKVVLAQTSLRLFLGAARAFAARYGWQDETP